MRARLPVDMQLCLSSRAGEAPCLIV